MENQFHTLSDLFSQLGLPEDPISIESFIVTHKPIPAKSSIEDLDVWSSSQVAFLTESREQDADWVEMVDLLDCMLH